MASVPNMMEVQEAFLISFSWTFAQGYYLSERRKKTFSNKSFLQLSKIGYQLVNSFCSCGLGFFPVRV